MTMNTRTLLALGALLAASTAAHAETDPYASYPVTVRQSGPDKAHVYAEVRKEAFDACDRDGGYLDAVNFDYIEGWGALNGIHFITARATCRVHP
jgi:hypothetical protein